MAVQYLQRTHTTSESVTGWRMTCVGRDEKGKPIENTAFREFAIDKRKTLLLMAVGLSQFVIAYERLGEVTLHYNPLDIDFDDIPMTFGHSVTLATFTGKKMASLELTLQQMTVEVHLRMYFDDLEGG